MVCPRCIDTVRDIFNTLKIDVTAIQLGEVIVSSEIEKNRKRIILKGELPSPLNPPKGCVFSSRCPKFSDECSKETPELAKFKNDHFVSCIKV